MKKILKKILISVIFVFSVLNLCSCQENENIEKIQSVYDLNDEKYSIGVGLGSNAQMIAVRDFKKAEIQYFNNEALGYNAVVAGQVDAYLFDRDPMQKAINSGMEGVRLLDDNLREGTQIAIGIPKNPRIKNIKDSINKCIQELKDDGTLDEMYNRWVFEENEEMPYIEEVKEPIDEFVIGTTGIIPPFTFYKGEELSGFDIELAERIAQKLNVKTTYKIYDYNGIIAALTTNDIDFASANLNITKERAEAVDFSIPIYENKITALVKDYNKSEHGLNVFVDNIKTGFEKTFIRENRYKLFIDGIVCTLKITIFAIILGTIFGFVLFLISYNTGKNINKILEIVFWLLRRIPIVVLLMVFYYIIFLKLSIDSEIVAIIVFIIIFSAEIAELLISTIKNVDIGQSEAAHALGFGKEKTFFKILLPQTLPIMFPTYKNYIVELVRSTAVVGYVAVQDLTKVGDIVRSRTYDAFFSLIAIAIIYIILAEIMITIIEKLNKAKTFGKESKYLKGVKRND